MDKRRVLIGVVATVAVLIAICAFTDLPFLAVAYVFMWVTGYAPGG